MLGGEGEKEECAVLTPCGKDDHKFRWVDSMALAEYVVQGNIRIRTICFVEFVELHILVTPFGEIDSHSW